MFGKLRKSICYEFTYQPCAIGNLLFAKFSPLRNSVPVFNTFATAGSSSVLGIEQGIATFPGLPSIKCRFCGTNRSSNSILRRGSHPDPALANCIIQGTLINWHVPEVVTDQLKSQRTECVFDIALLALMH